MRFLKRILAALVVIVVALVAVAYVLPRETQVQRSITIDAPPSRVFPHVNAMQATEAWSPWLDRDPDVQLTYEGPDSGVGNRLIWTSEHPQVGNGTQEITLSTPDERVETALDFGALGTADAWFALQPAGDGTQVTWGFTTDAGMNPMSRWMGLMMDRWVGADYEKGLAKLKAVVEAG